VNFKAASNFRYLFLFLNLFFTINSYCQGPLHVTKVSGLIKFDGIPDEEIWKKIPPLPIVTYSPVFGNEPCVKIIAKIAYDDEYVYCSSVYYYNDTVKIRAVSKKRDYNLRTTDMIGFIFDSFNDKQNAVAFYTTPNGLRADYTIKNDATGQSPFNFTWNTFWDVKINRGDTSWSAEFRIPLSSLRFQSKDGKTTMGLMIHCLISEKNELSSFPAVSPDINAAYWKPSLFSEILFEGLKPEKPVYITPYATSGLSQISELNSQATGYKIKSTPKYDAGLDVKYSLTKNLTTDITINTDFAQVEADDQKINLSRYSLYFPEKRVFFLGKADVLDFSFDGANNLFYSRRIGIYNGEAVRIYGGMRLAGRIKDWDVGILGLQTAPVKNSPGENFGVFRTKKNVFNQNSYVGGMVTSRLGMNGSYNVAYGVDGVFRVTGDEYLTLKMAQTRENSDNNKIKDNSPSRLLIEWQRRNEKGIGYDLLYSYSGEDFNPGIGFETREAYKAFAGTLHYGWFSEKNDPVRYQKISFSGQSILSSVNSSLESVKGSFVWQFDGKKGFNGSIIGNWFLENLSDTLILGNNQASVPPGTYRFGNTRAQFNTYSGKDISAGFIAEAGSFYDGWKLSLFSGPSFSIGSDLDLGLTYNIDFINFIRRDISFTNHILGMRGLFTMTTKISMSAFVQYNTSVDKVMTNFRFRYNPREGNDFYIVYDEGFNTNIYREYPRLSYTAARTILLKYTYTFSL
jgi:hypothetical protein